MFAHSEGISAIWVNPVAKVPWAMTLRGCLILSGYLWLETADIQACLVYASLLARHERIELFPTALATK